MQGSKAMPVKGKTKKLHVSNQVSLDADNPIPIGSGNNVWSFVHNVSYIPFLQPKDSFGQQLLEARLLSDTHNACIVTKKDYCAGEGFHYTDGSELDKVFAEWLTSMNLRNQSAVKINKKIFEDKFTWGNVPIEIVRMTVAGTKKLFI